MAVGLKDPPKRTGALTNYSLGRWRVSAGSLYYIGLTAPERGPEIPPLGGAIGSLRAFCAILVQKYEVKYPQLRPKGATNS